MDNRSWLNKNGVELFTKGDFDAALIAFGAALKCESGNQETFLNCARVAEALNCRNEAKSIYALCLGYFPDNEEALERLRQLHDHRFVVAEPKEKPGTLKAMLQVLRGTVSKDPEKLVNLCQNHRHTHSHQIYWVASALMKYYLPHCDLSEQQKWLSDFSFLLVGIKNELKLKRIDQLDLHSQYFISSYRYCVANSYLQKYSLLTEDRLSPDDAISNLVRMESWRLGCLDRWDIDLLEQIMEVFNTINPGICVEYKQYNVCFALMLFRKPSRIAIDIDSDAIFLSYLNVLKQKYPRQNGNVYCSRILSTSGLPEEYALWYVENFADISKYKDRHKEESCFIIGNGPSLRRMDLSPLRNRITFGLNKLYLLFDKMGFETSYLAAANAYVIKQAARHFSALSIPIFLMNWGREFMRKSNNVCFLRENYQSHFSEDITKGINVDCTVTHMAMQIAYFMGFKTVVLIGVDHHFESKGRPHSTVKLEGKDPNHFDPNYFGYGVPWQLPDLEGSERAFRNTKEVFEKDGRCIYDATVDGKLQIFPKISYTEALRIAGDAHRKVLDQQGTGRGQEGTEPLFKGSDTGAAPKTFTTSLELSSDSVTAHNDLGMLYWKTGEHFKAKQHFERALEIVPNDRYAMLNYERFLKSSKRASEISIRSFRNRYADKRLFILGNGPSLLKAPFKILEKEYTFAMNRIALMYSHHQWRPSFFLCTTTNVMRSEWNADILKSVELGIPCFVWDKLKPYLPQLDNIHYLKCYHGEEVRSEAPDEWWSEDIITGVSKFGTSMLPVLQISIYMGFKEIYLLGCDMGFKGTAEGGHDPNHFDSSYGTPGFAPEVLNMNMKAAHKLAARAAQRKGVKILNATVGGELEIYPRIDCFQLLDNGNLQQKYEMKDQLGSPRHHLQNESFLELLDPKKIDPFAYEQEVLNEIREHSRLPGKRIGWNYCMDYSWIAMQWEKYFRDGMRVLDIGCGPGAIHGYLEKKYGVDIIGIDMRRWDYDYVDIVGDFNDADLRLEYDLGCNTLDLIISVSAFEHNPPETHRRLVKTCLESLKPGGFLICTFSIGRIYSEEQSAHQWNLPRQEIEAIYGTKLKEFFYEDVWERWRIHREIPFEHRKRYGRWNDNDPTFLAAGAVLRVPTW